MPETFGSEGYIMSRLENSGIESKSVLNGSDLLSKTINNGTKFLKNLPSSDYKYQAEIDNAINEVLTTFKNEETTLETNYQNSRNEIISQSQTSLSKLKNDVVNNGGNVANNLDESKIREAIYSACHIDTNLENNNFLGQFTKGIIDSAIINNVELAKEVIKNPSILLDLAKQIFSYEGLKGIANSLGKSIMDLGSGEPYKTGVAVGELGIITTGTGAGLKLGKEALEVGLKKAVKKGVVEALEVGFKETVLKATELLKNKFKKEITELQAQAIFKAHNVGMDGAGPYTLGEMLEKSRILKDAGFTPAETRSLLEEGVCGKPDRVKASIDAGKTDLSEMRGNYLLNDSIKPALAGEKILEYSKHIDIKYLINDPDRIDAVLEITESMCDYVTKNKGSLQNLTLKQLNDFKYSFGELTRKIQSIADSKSLLPDQRLLFSEMLNDNFMEARYSLNPNFSPGLNN
ncbi:MAG: hypothetical protein PHF46_00890 [Candidatus Gracilibacteria bacterium]|nr:hypothetical protein [Candidatus Gracilibacteria bacterium]